MIEREQTDHVFDLLSRQPVAVLLGPRQIGETTLARMVFSQFPGAVWLDLESEESMARLANPEFYLRTVHDRLVVIDEVQRMPRLFPLLRSLVDEDRRPGRFLLLGSSSPALLKESAESLAGRVGYLELSGLSIRELPGVAIEEILVRGGFPLSSLAASTLESYSWRQDFLRAWFEYEVPALGIHSGAAAMRRFWTMLVHYQGQIWNAQVFASSLGVSPPTVRSWLEALEDRFMARRLLPYLPNLGKRPVKSPKVYLRDTGLAIALLGIADFDALIAHPSVGALWESFVVETIASDPRRNGEMSFYRTSAGAEVDLVLESSEGALRVAEAKFSLAPSVGKGFRQVQLDLKPRHSFVLYPGKQSYPIDENTWVLAPADWGRLWDTGGGA